MAEISLVSEDRRPTVRILACQVGERELQPILWGLEEEGIPAEVENVASGDAVALAKQASHMSSLNVGIALNGIQGQIVLHHRDLGGECPLFTLAMPDAGSAQLRVLGANAARLVKGDPLIFQEDVVAEDVPANVRIDSPRAGVEMNSNEAEVLDVIVRTVLELLAKE
jgi:hypothetical protein